MKRSWLYVIGVVLVVAAIAGIITAMNSSKKHTDSTAVLSSSTTNKEPFMPKQACIVFTLADAKQILGDNAKGGSVVSNTSSKDLEVSTCTYTQDTGSNAPTSASKSASLLVRSPMSGAGITSNQNQFGPLKPAQAQHVDGYGDNAYWDPQYGQFNILKHNVWYILSYGPITPSARTLDQAKQLADILINKM